MIMGSVSTYRMYCFPEIMPLFQQIPCCCSRNSMIYFQELEAEPNGCSTENTVVGAVKALGIENIQRNRM